MVPLAIPAPEPIRETRPILLSDVSTLQISLISTQRVFTEEFKRREVILNIYCQRPKEGATPELSSAEAGEEG